MFTQVRRRLTLWYVGVSSLLLALLLAITFLLVTREVRAAGDLELRLRAESLVDDDPARSLPSAGGSRGDRRERPENDDDDDEHDRERRPESLGTLAYVIASDLTNWAPLSQETLPGLPDLSAARTVVLGQRPFFSDLTTPQGVLRLYTVPAQRDGTDAIIQVARSSYFTARTLGGVATVVAGLGTLGLAMAGIAGYGLAGRAMQPVAAALQRQRDFVADAPHEPRTPLSLLRANAEVLARHPEQPVSENLDLVEDLLSETDRLSRLVADLLTLARADSGQAQIAEEVVDLSALLLHLCREVQPLADRKGLRFHQEIAPHVVVHGDPHRLRQLGLILLDNAIRYTDRGNILIRLEVDDHNQVTWAVEDTGRGIGSEHLRHVFERFYRADPSRGEDGGGTGLGLAIARWIAESHGGQITAASTVDKGSVFTVRLPSLGAKALE